MSLFPGPTVYCFDTSAWIDLWRRKYPRETFVTLWRNVEEGIAKGEIVTPDAVLFELDRQDDELARWIRQQAVRRPGFVVASDPGIQREAKALIQQYGVRNDADPFRVGAAYVRHFTVVSSEKRSDYPRERPKLPNLCEFLKVRCIGLLDVFREKNWTF